MMEKVYVDTWDEKEIIFSSLKDMETALNELANGKGIIGIYPEAGKRKARVISVSVWNAITDGKIAVSANVKDGEK